MSVFTTVTRADLDRYLAAYDVGVLENFHGISEGIENTNYFVDTRHEGRLQQFVLTIFERLNYDDLPYFLGLMAHLHCAGVPTPAPVPLRDGRLQGRLHDKPAALVQRIDGLGVGEASLDQCRAIGGALAMLHQAGRSFDRQRAPDRGLDWCADTAGAVLPDLSDADAALLQDELSFQQAQDRSALPTGVIHADLFRDNALFVGQRLVGLIDFYYACNDRLLYDLAVAANDWCWTPGIGPDRDKLDALLAAYEAQRPLGDAERALWHAELRASALRFWLSRLFDKHFPRGGDLTLIKDPGPQRQRLTHWRKAASA